MIVVLAALLAVSSFLFVDVPTCDAGGFDRAIDYGSPRVVKLYGLEAGPQAGYGSGIVISAGGHVLTPSTLLIDAVPVRVVDSLGRRFDARVLYRDERLQVALLEMFVSPPHPLEMHDDVLPEFPFFDLTHDAELLPGDWVIAAGNAFKVAEGAEPVSLAHGVFSARTRMDARRRVRDYPYRGDVLVIDAITSNPGGPGSALMNLDGDLVGMIGRSVTSNLTNTHFNYAMPLDVLRDFYQRALDPSLRILSAAGVTGASTEKHFDSGIRLAKTGYRRVLPFVERVKRKSAAARAGVRKDDLILSVNGKSVSTFQQCATELRAAPPDEPLHLVLRRGKEIVTIDITQDTTREMEQ